MAMTESYTRRDCVLAASTVALKSGRDPFEPSIEAGINDATEGRLFADRFRRGHDRAAYSLGWELGRHCLLNDVRARGLDEASARAIFDKCAAKPVN